MILTLISHTKLFIFVVFNQPIITNETTETKSSKIIVILLLGQKVIHLYVTCESETKKKIA